MIVNTAPQGSDEWAEARRGVITASRFRDCRSKLKSGAPSKECTLYAMDVARERCGGRAPSKFQSAAMRTGTEEEPRARIAYEMETGNVVTEAGFITTDDRRFGASVDGLVGDDGIIEIKTLVGSETMFRALTDGDITDYRDQCNGELWLLGRKWVELILWAPDLEPIGKRMTILRIDRDEAAIQALEDDLLTFIRTVDQYEAALRMPVAA